MKTLKVNTLASVLQVAAISIPFTIKLDQGEYSSFFQGLFKNHHWWNFRRPVDVPKHTANGYVDYYDEPHGHLDHGHIVQVTLKARRCWPWGLVEISGVTNPIGRFCFTGWGEMKLRIVGPVLNFELSTMFKTVIV
jgi:hypothetical protein